MRTSEIKRKTNETDIELYLNLDGNGTSNIDVINLISTTFNISAWDILASRMS